jgi:DNA-directed RNA polymerase subunit RPC12/RpoP
MELIRCGACGFDAVYDSWQALPRPSSEARDIARDLEDLLENYHDRVNDWVAAIPQDELTPFISRLEQIADSGDCEYVYITRQRESDGISHVAASRADADWLVDPDERIECWPVERKYPAVQSSADVPIKLTDTVGPDEHTKDLLAKLRDSQKYAMELEDRIDEMSRADVPGEVWVCVRDHEGRGKVIAVAADLAAVDKSPGPWVGPISVQGVPKETTEGEMCIECGGYGFTYGAGNDYTSKYICMKCNDPADKETTEGDIECDSCDKRIEYEGLHEYLMDATADSEAALYKADRYLRACKRMHREWRKERGWFRAVARIADERVRWKIQRDEAKAALEECHDALERKHSIIKRLESENKEKWIMLDDIYGYLHDLGFIPADDQSPGACMRAIRAMRARITEIERLEKELDKQCSVFHSAMDKQADQIGKLSISDSKHRAEVVRLKEGIGEAADFAIGLCGYFPRPSEVVARIRALLDDTKGEGCDYVKVNDMVRTTELMFQAVDDCYYAAKKAMDHAASHTGTVAIIDHIKQGEGS